MPQAIGKTLIGISFGKKISKGNATHHISTLQEEGIKERNNKRKELLYSTLSQLELRLGVLVLLSKAGVMLGHG